MRCSQGSTAHLIVQRDVRYCDKIYFGGHFKYCCLVVAVLYIGGDSVSKIY